LTTYAIVGIISVVYTTVKNRSSKWRKRDLGLWEEHLIPFI
jgi:hypothetical protein